MPATIPPPTQTALGGVETFPVPVILLGPRNIIRYASQPLGGRAPEALRGIDLLGLVHPSHRAHVEASMRERSPHAFDLPLSEPDGHTTWFRASVGPSPDGAGLILLATDINHEHLQQERLRDQERLLEDAQGTAHMGTWHWDITKPHAEWSTELFHIYALDPATHVPTYDDYLTRIHPDDVERVKLATTAAFQELKPYSHDERIRRPDGSWRYLHTWAHPVLDAEGKLAALNGVCQDITDRKESELKTHLAESRFRAIFDHSAVGMALLDAKGHVLELNGPLAAMIGGRSTFGSRDFQTLLHVDDRAAVEGQLGALGLPGSPPARTLQGLLLRESRDELKVRVVLARVEPAPGAEPFILATVEPSAGAVAAETDRLAFAQQMEIRQLQESGERRSRLLQFASHELRNPLTPVVFQVHMLMHGTLGPVNERQARALGMVSKQVSRITHLLRDVLDMARIEEGRLQLRPTPMDIASSIEHAVDTYADLAVEWGTHLRAHVDPGAWALADPDRVEQVVVNLVSNALKFTPAGGRIDVHCVQEDGGVLVQVKDTGRGMDEEQQGRLFRAFSQVHEPGASREQGTGLGLFISNSIVQAMGGRMAVTSSPGIGSTFSFWLPAATRPAADEA